MLWPDADGDSAHEAFAVNLRRLRKLLGEETMVSLQNKTVSLDDSQIWVDTWAFGRLTRQIQEECSDDSSLCALSSKVIGLYHGPFLGKEGESYPWAQSFRDHFRNKFRRALLKCGDALIKKGKLEETVQLFEKGIELDKRAEEFYLNLMVAYQAMGRESEAMRVCRRCKRIVAGLHHIPLSSQIETLYRKLQGL